MEESVGSACKFFSHGVFLLSMVMDLVFHRFLPASNQKRKKRRSYTNEAEENLPRTHDMKSIKDPIGSLFYEEKGIDQSGGPVSVAHALKRTSNEMGWERRMKGQKRGILKRIIQHHLF